MTLERSPRVVVLASLALATAAVFSPVGSSGRLSDSRRAASQSLTVAAGADASYENPKLPTIGKYPTNANIFETLVMTRHYQLAPGLATSWKFIAPNTWRFHLRRGVRFQNGTPFDAIAV